MSNPFLFIDKDGNTVKAGDQIKAHLPSKVHKSTIEDTGILAQISPNLLLVTFTFGEGIPHQGEAISLTFPYTKIEGAIIQKDLLGRSLILVDETPENVKTGDSFLANISIEKGTPYLTISGTLTSRNRMGTYFVTLDEACTPFTIPGRLGADLTYQAKDSFAISHLQLKDPQAFLAKA
jgi:hypothetical protein